MAECRKEENLKSCGCTYTECEKRGMCCECIRYHRQKGEIPGCLFPQGAEKSYDRSVKSFIESQQKG